MSKILNQTVTHTCPAQSAYSKSLATKTDGQNTGGFENRASQEQGSH